MITLTEEQFKEMIEAAHRAGQRNQGHCDPSAYEAMVYYEREVKKLIIPAVSKSEDIERDTSCKHSDWIDLYYSSGDIYGRYCMDCGEFFE